MELYSYQVALSSKIYKILHFFTLVKQSVLESCFNTHSTFSPLGKMGNSFWARVTRWMEKEVVKGILGV